VSVQGVCVCVVTEMLPGEVWHSSQVFFKFSQKDFAFPNQSCTSSSLLYAYWCTRWNKKSGCNRVEEYRGAIPSDGEMEIILRTASELHETTRRRNNAPPDSIFSVHDIVKTTDDNENTWIVKNMTEIQGTFDEDILASFQSAMKEAQGNPENVPQNNELLEKGVDAHVYSIREALDRYLGENTAGVLTVEDCAHTVCVFKQADGVCALFDPLPGHILIFDSHQQLVRYIETRGFRSQYTMYCMCA
jgi:hypothetical protein